MGLGLSLLSSFGISGLGSPFGLALRTWVFRWADLFLKPVSLIFQTISNIIIIFMVIFKRFLRK